MSRVSIIIPSYNRAHLIGETIESVLSQSFSDFELIIVDDGSTDKTGDVVRKYQGPIKYLYQENQGRSSARNEGYKASQGEYICFLDSDDMLAPRMLEQQVALLDSNPNLGFVYTDYQFVDESGVPLPKPEIFRAHPLRRGTIFRYLIYFDFIPPSTILSRRDSIDEAGLFDPSLEPAEDLDWLLRISRCYETDYLTEPLCFFRKHAGSTPEVAIQDATIRVITKHLDDKATKRSLGEEWTTIYYELYHSVANYHYNRHEMTRAREFYYKALAVCPYKLSGIGTIGLVIRSYLGGKALNSAKRLRGKLT